MYITIYKVKTESKFTPKQLTIEDFLLNNITEPEKEHFEIGTGKIITIEKDEKKLMNLFLSHFDNKWYNIPEPPKWPISEIKEHYTSFNIPKKTGGLRHIDAPDDELKTYLSSMKKYFEDTLKILTHDCAHAYVKQRCTVTALEQHQKNDSKWFLKLDLKDFFPSHNLEYTLKCLKQLYPIGILMHDENYTKKLTEALKYAFLDDVLPQGTPLSPTLTNICMTPLDYKIQHMVWNQHFNGVYTRYADDLLISSKYKFEPEKIETYVKNIFKSFNAPFTVKSEKTRFGSSAGRNWNLGIMLNKDNKLTIGHKQNQRFRAMIHNLIRDEQNGQPWSYHDKQVLAGDIAYYKAIEPDYVQHVIDTYQSKFSVNLKDILNPQ